MNSAIVVVTCVVSFLAWRNQSLMQRLIFFGPAVSRQGQYDRLLTHALVHQDFWHLLFNMITVWSFGEFVQSYFVQLWPGVGSSAYLVFYCVAAVVAIYPTYLAHKSDSAYASLGASGAASAVLAVAVVLDPLSNVYIYGFGMPGWLYLIAFTALSVVLGRNPNSGINHNAHLAGTAFGVVAAFATAYLGGIDLWTHFINSFAQ